MVVDSPVWSMCLGKNGRHCSVAWREGGREREGESGKRMRREGGRVGRGKESGKRVR